MGSLDILRFIPFLAKMSLISIRTLVFSHLFFWGLALFLANEVWAQEFNRPRQISSHPAQDFAPAVSPDQKFMIFVSDRAGNLDLWLKHLSPGLNPPDRPLTFHTASDSSPAISPDGKKIVFVSNRSDAKGDLYLLDLNKIGSKDNPPEPVRLTQDDFMDDDPVWSPDQKNIFFTSHHPETGKETLFRVEVKTGKRYLVLEDGGVDPAVSPGGRRLAYVTGDGLKGLWVFDLVTGKKNRLSKGDTMDVSPRWSADGNKIFFARYQDDTNFDGQLTIDDNPNIWSIEVTGSNPGIERQLTDSSYYDLFPVPASNRRLFFTSNRKKNIDIWEIPAEGLISVRKGYGPVLQDFVRKNLRPIPVFWPMET